METAFPANLDLGTCGHYGILHQVSLTFRKFLRSLPADHQVELVSMLWLRLKPGCSVLYLLIEKCVGDQHVQFSMKLEQPYKFILAVSWASIGF